MLPKFCLISDLLQKMSKPTNTPQLALDCSTMLYRLLGSSFSRTGGINPMLLQEDLFLLVLLELFQLNAKQIVYFKKVTLAET